MVVGVAMAGLNDKLGIGNSPLICAAYLHVIAAIYYISAHRIDVWWYQRVRKSTLPFFI